MAIGSHIKATIYTNQTEISWKFPAKWAICRECEGCGTDRGRSVECDGGGFTASEWDEQDEEFREDYMAGRYDRPCEGCDGKGRVQVIDKRQVTGWRDKILLRALRAQERDNAEIDAIQAAERRMGA